MGKELSDKRFSGLKRDPRFRKPSAKKSKTVLDARFKHILTDEKFRGASGKNPRGMGNQSQKKGKQSRNKDMEQFYDVETPQKPDFASDDDIDLEDDKFQWDAESSSSEDEEAHDLQDEANLSADDKEDVELGDSTDKIAVMNCNWDIINATDLYVLIQSFLDDNAPGRKLLKVTIHKSDYGAERMEREEQFGPLIEGMPSDNEEDDSLKTQAELDIIEKKRLDAIRRYEKQKRMYFFAIAEFDSINTACIVYDELDGVAAGYCSESMDLRFVPEDTPDPSSKRDPASFADHIPESYTPPLVEVGDVTMQHSKVKLTWDEDPPERKILMKKLTPAQIRDLDLEAYLESDDNEEEAVDADQIRKALLGDDDSGSEEAQESDREESADQQPVMGDMEMSFSREVESIGKNVAMKLNDPSSKDPEDMSVWEKYLQKRKEARKTKKAARREQIEQQRQERIATAKANAKAAKKSREAEEDSSDEDNALFNESRGDLEDLVQDSRLDKLFSDSRFAVDPTHPSYKKSSVINSIKRKNSKK